MEMTGVAETIRAPHAEVPRRTPNDNVHHTIMQPLTILLFAAIAQPAQAATISLINGLGYNASINQTIVGALAGAGTAAEGSNVDRRLLRNILPGWLWSPLLGVSTAAVASVARHRIFHA